MKRRKFSRVELIKVHELLKAHLFPIEGVEGLYVYQDGWSDLKVAQAIEEGVTPSAVAHVRAELFGRVRIGKSSSSSPEPRIAALEDLVRNLAITISQLVTKHDKLCDNLSLNRVVDVKHLKNGTHSSESRV